nr:zinc-binding dehydrogenase [Nocardia sp. XZ_19_369]
MLGIRFAGVGDNMPEALDEAVDLITRGRLYIPVAQAYSLTEAAAAHADSQAGYTRGRRVLLV